MIKKFLLLLLIISMQLNSKADEGMWLPLLISQNYDAMQRLGFKLTPEQIYNINKGSMKDAIVHFGGGCTGEMISSNGLLLTNHHCGYGSIAKVSSVENNYLMNGFMANSLQDEIPAPGLSVKFLVRMEDVTNQVVKYIGNEKGKEYETKLSEISKEISKAASENGAYECDVKSFYAGNAYYLFVYETFTDVRLVSAPPENLGKFGGDTDHWMWPRHTCDYSMFRVYSNNDNKPAAYSKNNRPYVPKYHLPISMKGVRDNDYAMIMGYPGRTTRYLTSYGVDLAINFTNPSIVKIRDKRLSIMREAMQKDPAIDLKYATTYAQIANYWKYFIGQTEQLKNLNILSQKQNEERKFQNWVNDQKKYKNILSDYQKAYSEFQPYAKHQVYYREALFANNLTKIAASFETIVNAYDANVSDDSLSKLCTRLKAIHAMMMPNVNLEIDQNLFAAMNLMFYQDIPKGQHPDIFSNEIFKKFGDQNWQKTFDDYAAYVFSNTLLLDSLQFSNHCNPDKIETLLDDPAVQYAMSIVKNYKKYYEPKVNEFNTEMNDLNRLYQEALLEKNNGTLMYPDANSTMRLSYGKVSSYSPKDAVFYNYYTLADGLLQKYKAGDSEFDLQPAIVDVLKNKDYGTYEDKKLGGLVTCFITNNDITGGNSGSPVINGDGELIGCAFDGNWEAMSGDIAFDQRFKRTINVDIRYILWTVDKVLNGRRLIDEMTIRY
ncbi:MAG: S46 family peptidase [Chitinophagaceae bacterium]|nr:S46 family peptidase [Chitinophagaceae bacterium]